MGSLSQYQADQLLALAKHRTDEKHYLISGSGDHLSVPLVSADGHEEFTLDIHRGRIDLRKGTYQNRTQQNYILARLDFGGAPHRNPDDEEIPCPHLHLYREGFGDKWAFPVPDEHFSDLANSETILNEFMTFCNIVTPPNFQHGAF